MFHHRKKEEYKLSYIAMGLIVGFFIGGGLVYLYTNRQNDSFERYNPLVYLEEFFNEEAITNVSDQDVGEQSGNFNDSGFDKVPEPEKPGGEPGYLNEVPANSPGITDNPDPYADITWDAARERDLQNDDIVIKQDRLKQVKAYYLPAGSGSNNQSQPLKQLDSLLGNFSRNNPDKNLFYVEFWESPLNYKGYRMGQNKLVVYGVEQIEFASLNKYYDEYFLRYLNNFYPLVITNEFKPLVPISDTELIEQFQQQWP